MFEFLKNIYRWTKALFLWGINADNRKVGLRVTKQFVDMLEVFASLTPTKTDDQAVAWLARRFDDLTKINGLRQMEDIENVARAVSDATHGDIKNLKIGYGENKINASLGGVKLQYDPSNGQVKFGIGGSLK